MNDDTLGTQSHVLERVRYAMRHVLPPHLAQSVSVELEQDYFERLVLTFRTELLADTHPPLEITKTALAESQHYRTWWDHWKADHATCWYARWWVRRHPPEMQTEVAQVAVTVNLERRTVFPEPPGWVSRAMGRRVVVERVSAVDTLVGEWMPGGGR